MKGDRKNETVTSFFFHRYAQFANFQFKIFYYIHSLNLFSSSLPHFINQDHLNKCRWNARAPSLQNCFEFDYAVDEFCKWVSACTQNK